MSKEAVAGKEELKENNEELKEKIFTVIKLAISFLMIMCALLFVHDRIVSTVVYVSATIIVGYEMAIDFIKNILHFNFFDENTLMIIACVTAFVIGQFFEGAIIILLFVVGELLEDVATEKARTKIADLSDMKITVCHTVIEGRTTDVVPETVEIGTVLEIKKGETVPIDGRIISSCGVFDCKAITGESKYFEAVEGDVIYGGAINVGDCVLIKTIKKYEDSAAQKIIATVESATAKKSKSQRFISSFAKVYTPVVVVLGLLIAVLPPLFDGMNFAKWIYKALSFIVISCPCALVISVPLAFFMGIGGLAKKGILVKGSHYIDLVGGIKCVAFDKTGTLTDGQFKVVHFETSGGFVSEQLLKAVYGMEIKSTHPIAGAICSYISSKNVMPEYASKISETSGKGISAVVDGKQYFIGSVNACNNLLEKQPDLALPNNEKYTAVCVLCDGALAGYFLLEDAVKQDAVTTVDYFKKKNIKTVMLTGDNGAVATDVAENLCVDECCYGLLPSEKTDKISALKGYQKGKVMYVGDGINDAPSLIAADVGVAMGGLGSDLAVDSADIILMNDKIENLKVLFSHSKKIRKIVYENIAVSLSVKAIIMMLGIFVGIPIGLAVFADVGVMLLAVLNSFRAFLIKNNLL